MWMVLVSGIYVIERLHVVAVVNIRVLCCYRSTLLSTAHLALACIVTADFTGSSVHSQWALL
jgi:hypothetical protein